MGEGYGVVGDGYGSGFAGVLGRNNNGPGLQGEGGPGVWGRATKEGHPAVLGDRGPDGTPGEGVAGVGVGEGFGNAGVRGRNWDGGGFGVIGDGGAHAGGVFGRNAFESGTGVVGVATESIGGIGVSGRGQDAGVRGDSANGYGGRFAGGKAQLMLAPGGAVGRPTGDHTKGEIYMDSAGALFVCTADGSPGTWKKVTTTLAP
jgi:hypothetical protein